MAGQGGISMRTMGRMMVGAAMLALLRIGSAEAESLSSVVQDAYLFNPSIDAARYALRAQGEGVAIANAGRLPTLSANSSIQLNRSFVPDPLSDDTTAPISLGLTGNLPLYDGGRTANSVSQARANIDTSYAQLVNVEQTTMLNAVSTYFDVLRDKEIRDLSVASLKLLLEELEGSEARFEVGEVTITDVAQTKAQVAAANASVIQSDGNLRASAEQFRSFVGRLPGELEPPEFLPRVPSTAAAAESIALASHPTIRAARSAERAAVYAIKVIQADNLPTIGLGSQVNGNLTNTLEGTGNRNLTVGLQLNLNAPIYQGGSVDSRIRQAQHTASQRRADYHVAVREVQRAVNVAWQSYVTAEGAIKAQEEQVLAATIAFDGIREELLVGSRATIDVLDAEQALLNARIALVNAVRALNVAAYTLISAMGRLEPEFFGIEPVVELAGGIVGVEPVSPYGVVKDETVLWRFPWRP